MNGNGNAPVTRADLDDFKRELIGEIGQMMDARFHQVDDHFTKRLGEVEDRFTKRLGDVEDRFTKRLGDVEDRFTKRFGEFEQQLVAVEERLVEQLRDSETKLLRGFYQYQEHADVRMRKMSADISNMDTASDLRLNNLERRVIELEKKMRENGR